MTENGWRKELFLLKRLFKDGLSKVPKNCYAQHCVENEEIRFAVNNYLVREKLKSTKCNKVSSAKRNEGNEKYKKFEFENSLELYTQSILYSEENYEGLSLAYSNRALALQSMGYYLEAMQDIELALRNGYPNEKLKKLAHREAKCLRELGFNEEAEKVLYYSATKDFKKGILKLIEEINKNIKSKENFGKIELPQVAGGKNNNFESASKYINVFYNETKGRHVIATHDINVGDVLFVEKPFAYVVVKHVCQSCCKQIIAPIPCDKCLDIVYCSLECKEKCSTHLFECGFGKLFESIGIAHLSLRIILVASKSVQELKENLLEKADEPHKEGEIVSQGNKYINVYNLVTNMEKHDNCDSFEYALTALLLGLYLKNYTSYFSESSDTEELKVVVNSLWMHIMQLTCNTFAITGIATRSANTSLLDYKMNEKIGMAIYPSASMMNHSCEPSVVTSFYNECLIVKASKPIMKGEEVFTCYGPNAQRNTRAERQKILSQQYFFKCECQSCQFFDIQEKFLALQCLNCKGPSVSIGIENPNLKYCLHCSQTSLTSKEILEKQCIMDKLTQDGEDLIDCNINQALRKFVKSWSLGRKIYYKFHIKLCYVADKIAFCLAMLEDFKRSINFLKCVTLSVEERFGSLSVELAYELKKLGEAILAYCAKSENADEIWQVACEGLKCFEKCKTIFSTLYGQFSEEFQSCEKSSNILRMIMKINYSNNQYN